MSDLTTLEQIERRIGQAPDTASFTLTASNREAVEDWLIAQGFDETRIRSARDDTIRKAYSVPNFRRALKHRSDYYPAASRTTQETRTDEGFRGIGTHLTHGTETEDDLRRAESQAKPRADECGIEGRRREDHPPPPAIEIAQVSDHAAVLASAIQALAGHGITEQRVIALIEKHVPAIVRQVLSEAMAAVAVNLDLE